VPWPDAAAVKRKLGITSASTEVDGDVELALDAAIEQVLFDVGRDPDIDSGEVEPTASLEAAALLLACACFKAPDAPYGVAAVFDTGGLYVARDHPNYQRLLVGARETFGVA
jgi:hypothetical protein